VSPSKHESRNLKPQRTPIEALTATQQRYANVIKSHDLVFAVGPAGTGKTYMPTALAAEALMDKRVEKIIISRPAVEAGDSMGFLPGELEEKYEPYLAPVRQIFVERMGTGSFEYALKSKKIEPIPINFMSGMTFKYCWVILDEAQNVTPKQMKMLLTRIGENCKVIVCGDTDQKDITGLSGLADAVRRTAWIKSVRTVKFTIDDVVRSGMVRDILISYAKEDEEQI
jgi:phosphate starvation-inducible PhoH-like protein